MVDATDVDEDDVVYVLRYFHGGKFVSSPKFDYVDWKVDRLQVDPDILCYWDIIRNVSAFGVDLYVECLEEEETVNGGNVVVGNNVGGSSYDHVVGQEHVDVGSQVEDGGSDAENGPQHVEVGPKLAENEPQIGDNESSDDNGLEHVEVGPEITNIWADHVDVGAGVADVNGNGADHVDVGADHVDVDDDGNGADQVDVGPGSENGSQHAKNMPDYDNGLDHVDAGPGVDDVEPELGDDKPELADDQTIDVNGVEDGVDGEKGIGKRHKEKAADREGQPVQPDNVDEGNRSSDKDEKLDSYETDYISSSDPGEYEDSEQSDDDVPRVRQSLLPRYDPKCVIPVWELGLRFDNNEQFKEAVRKYAFAKGTNMLVLGGYAVELLKSNPGSTISIQVHRNDVGQAVFFRIYVCFQALKQGWKDGCRPFIEVDGCWLKTAKKGELLVVVGRDANNQMFPIAWVVVDVECASSWRWFLKKLFTDLEHPTGEGLHLFQINKRMCATYLYANWQRKGRNPVQHWAKAYFSATSTCDAVDNNMAEAFNAWILDARCKTIISLLEDIRVMVMSRLHVKRTWASKWRTNISPKALEKLEHNMEQSTHCRLVWNGDGGFEVQHGEDQHIVVMKQLKCTCRAWELSGIPCCHSICAMYQENKRPEDYVSSWYNKAKYLPAYNHVLQPNVASSTTGPPGMVHGTTQNVASATTQNVASATTGPPGIVQSTT
ncbi:hypothetical protein V6N13_042564 [Hibiscus sabdariffa]